MQGENGYGAGTGDGGEAPGATMEGHGEGAGEAPAGPPAPPPEAGSEQEAGGGDPAKRERFRRMGNAELKKALTAMTKLRNLADTRRYEFDREQIARMTDALRSAVEDVVRDYESALDRSAGYEDIL